MKRFALLLGFMGTWLFLMAQEETEYDFSGFADTYHAVRSSEPYMLMSSRTRLRTELDISRGRSSLFASLNSKYNAILDDQNGIELREAYFDFSSEHWDFRAGRQIVIWGVSDGMRITDVVSPMDMTEFLARDYDDIRIPVNALKLGYSNTFLRSELIFIPVSSFFIFPDSPDNPWSVFPTSGFPVYEVDLEQFPEKRLANSEFGGRVSFFLSGLDFSIAALHSWNKMPVLEQNPSTAMDTLFVKGLYERMDMLGADFSFPLWQLVIRGEAALYLGEIQGTDPGTGSDIVLRNTGNFLFGVDWYPGHEWTITAQYSHKFIPDYIERLDSKKNTALGTLGITKKVFRSTLSLSTFAYVDLSNKGFFMRSSADYALSDQIHLMLGYDWFHGDEGMFALYNQNSEIWIKAKYSF
ncbi:MAG: hypothetical protein KAR19_02515 [Bacteroidales bacterium]|nr:hypothetical protein [Bacteroidales bacterium]